MLGQCPSLIPSLHWPILIPSFQHACVPEAQFCSLLRLSDEGSHGEDAMTMSYVGPGGRRDGDEVVTEIDECSYVVPVIEIIVLHVPVDRKRHVQGLHLESQRSERGGILCSCTCSLGLSFQWGARLPPYPPRVC